MARTVTLNGITYELPDTGEKGWGENVTNYLIDLSTAFIQKSGGLYALTADLDFGSTHGVIASKFQSRTVSPALSGAMRLAYTDKIAFRNAANSGDIKLGVDSAGRLTVNDVPILGSGEDRPASTVSVVPAGNLSSTNAQAALVELQTNIDSVENLTNSGYDLAAGAQEQADTATTLATTAQNTASAAQFQAIAAENKADAAQDTADTALTLSLANQTAVIEAQASADTAQSTADAAQTQAAAVLTIASAAKAQTDAATSSNTAGTIVKRDGSGNFSANIITADVHAQNITANAVTVDNGGDPFLDALIVNGSTTLTGSVFVNGNLSANPGSIGAQDLYPEHIRAYSGFPLTVHGGMDAAATGIDFLFKSDVTRTAGKLLSVQNNGVEKFSVDYAGNISYPGTLSIASLTLSGALSAATATASTSVTTPTLYADLHSPKTADTAITLKGNRVAGSTGSGIVMDTSVTRTAGKIFSICNNAVEKFAVDYNGAITLTGPAVNSNALTIPDGSRLLLSGSNVTQGWIGMANGLINLSGNAYASSLSIATTGNIGVFGNASLLLNGGNTDSSTSVGVEIYNKYTYSTLGAKVARFRNNTTEVLAVTKDGDLLFRNTAGATFGYSVGSSGFTSNGKNLFVTNGTNAQVYSDSFVGNGDSSGRAAYFYGNIYTEADIEFNGGGLLMQGGGIIDSFLISSDGLGGLYSAGTGRVRMMKNEAIGWRNSGNTGDNVLQTGASDDYLYYNGNRVGYQLSSAEFVTGAAGNITSNTLVGSCQIPAGSSSVTITNNKILSANAVIECRIVDATANSTLTYLTRVVPSSGQFIVYGNAAATTSAVKINFYVVFPG